MGRGSSKIGGGGALFSNGAFTDDTTTFEEAKAKWNSFRQSFGSVGHVEENIIESEYTGTGKSFALNRKLYNGKEDELTMAQKGTMMALDKAISEHHTPSNAVYTRYSSKDAIQGILGLSDSQMSQLLGIPSFSNSDMALLNKAVGGTETLSKGYNSTSAIKQHLFSNQLFRREISVPKGTNAYCSKNRSEHEVIFGRNMKTVLDHISYDGQNIVLHEKFLGYN